MHTKCPECNTEFTPENYDEIKTLRAENARYIERIEELTSELSKLKAQADRHREALEFYAWTCEPTKIQRSDNSGTLVMVEDKEKALACYNEDLFLFGKRAREVLKGEE